MWLAAVSLAIASRLLLIEETKYGELSQFQKALKQGVTSNLNMMAKEIVEVGLQPPGDWLWRSADGHRVVQQAIYTVMVGQSYFKETIFMDQPTIEGFIQ